ncbi:MAG: DUF4956 domain-containing protein [Bacteroidetes bacterium]|nr:DUF4956 domain-containing protein [Bacteroidota bacterium]MBU1114905.1 DUF4956 domain-containing protein [Bacteroidota bacterium]MBU1799385.1 DUF4956 domain-containing protein [Bacteroidota bacterium]
MFNDFSTIFQYSLSTGEIIENILIALLCALFISFFYKKTYNGPGYLDSFANALILLSLITAVVIMIIGNNLARAFGLVGAMSIIRFRTAVKETHDIVYIFFALTIGMASGVGLHSLAIVGTAFIGIISFVISKVSTTNGDAKSTLLEFQIEGNNEKITLDYKKVLSKYTKRMKLINIKSFENQNMLISYYIKIKNESQSINLVNELQNISGIKNISLFSDEEAF